MLKCATSDLLFLPCECCGFFSAIIVNIALGFTENPSACRQATSPSCQSRYLQDTVLIFHVNLHRIKSQLKRIKAAPYKTGIQNRQFNHMSGGYVTHCTRSKAQSLDPNDIFLKMERNQLTQFFFCTYCYLQQLLLLHFLTHCNYTVNIACFRLYLCFSDCFQRWRSCRLFRLTSIHLQREVAILLTAINETMTLTSNGMLAPGGATSI